MPQLSGPLRLSDHPPIADIRRTLRIAVPVLAAHLSLAAVLVLTGPAVSTPPRPVPIQISLLSAGAATAIPQRPPVPKSETSRPPTPATPPSPEPRAPVSAPSAPAASAEQRVTEPRTESLATAPTTAAPSPSRSSAAPSAPPAPDQTDRQPSVDASFKGNRVPDYPLMSRRLGEQGVVVLRVLISTEGRAVEVRLIRSSGSDRLDRSAMDAIREWRFIPATRGGRPEPAWYEWRWEFRLSG